MKYLFFAAVMAPCMLTGGCAVPIIGPLTLTHLSSIATAATMTTEGKGAGEVALDLATGKDCRMMEGFFRNDREICEQRGSTATQHDFKGVIALLTNDPAPSDELHPAMLAAVATPPAPGIRTLKRNRPEAVNSRNK